MVQVNHVVSYLQDFPTENSEGHLIIESDQDTRAWVSLIDRQSLDSNVMLASDETANRVLIPSSVTSDRYSSGLVVVNTSAATGSLKITIRNAGGSTLGTRSEVPVAPQGSIYFKDIFQTAGIAPGSKAFGPIEIESLTGAQMQAVLLIRTTGRTGGFLPGINLNRGARNLLLPYVADSPAVRTNLGLNNTGVVTASVSVSLTTAEGFALVPRRFSLPPNSLTQLDSVVRLLGGESTHEGWIRVTADQDIFAWTSLIDNQTQDPALSVAVSLSATKWLIPSATSAGSFTSGLALANLESEPAPVVVTVRNAEGTVMKSTAMTIPASGMFVSQDILATLGLPGRFGPVEITSPSGKPLLAASRVVSGQCTGSVFAAVPLEPQRNVLYLTHSAGFQHEALPLSENVLREIGAASRAFGLTVAGDSDAINPENLRNYDAVVFYTSGELPLSDVQKAALLDFVGSGKGFVGIHSATDTLYSWPEYGELIGGYFDGHPWHQEVTIQTEDPVHAATRHLSLSFRITDEIYQFRGFVRERLHGLLRLDNNSVNLSVPGVNRSDGDFALAWTRSFGSGRVFYTALGHREEVWQDKRFQQHLLNGIRWTMRDLR
jgi:type 1 glutamine amidotransferase